MDVAEKELGEELRKEMESGAQSRRAPRKKVTAVHKANIMRMSDGLFLKCCRQGMYWVYTSYCSLAKALASLCYAFPRLYCEFFKLSFVIVSKLNLFLFKYNKVATGHTNLTIYAIKIVR